MVCRHVTKNLRQGGRVLTDLAAHRDGSLYGSAVWRFVPQPGSRHIQAPQEGKEESELPYHRFAHRDALLLSMQAGVDAEGAPVFVSIPMEAGLWHDLFNAVTSHFQLLLTACLKVC